MKAVTGLFTPSDTQRAVDRLHEMGFAYEDLSIISSVPHMPEYLEGEPEESAVSGAAVGALTGGTLAALGTWAVAAVPGFETMVAAGFLNTAAGSVIGGFLGSLFAVRAESQAKLDVHEELSLGKILLVVRAGDRRAETAASLMEKSSGEHVVVHEIVDQ